MSNQRSARGMEERQSRARTPRAREWLLLKTFQEDAPREKASTLPQTLKVGPVDKTDSPFTGLDTGRATQPFGIPHQVHKQTLLASRRIRQTKDTKNQDCNSTVT